MLSANTKPVILQTIYSSFCADKHLTAHGKEREWGHGEYLDEHKYSALHYTLIYTQSAFSHTPNPPSPITLHSTTPVSRYFIFSELVD